MLLTDVSLQQFRSYEKKTFLFSPQVTVIIGPNGAGKTNILEALSVLSTGKSFRAETTEELLRWGEEVGRVRATLGESEVELVVTAGLVAGIRTPTKRFLVNGVARRAIDFVGNLRSVLFWPEDLQLITAGPSLRRRYLDSVLLQVDREYRRNLYSYEKGLRQRNKLLALIKEERATRSQLLFWDQLLIKAGGYITDARAAYIEYCNTHPLPTVTHAIEYDKSVISVSRLEQYAMEEVAAKVTLVGPHRDDFTVHAKLQSTGSRTNAKYPQKEYRDLSKYGSRGEQRLGVLWLKLTELAYIVDQVGDRPVLLLDDIFSELDEEHRAFVLSCIRSQQTVITSADTHICSILDEQQVLYTVLTLSG